MTTHTDRTTAAGAVLAVSAATSVQFGAALAATLFPLVGPIGTVSLRFLGAAAVLLLLTRPWRARWSRRDLRTVVAFGVVFVAMNVSLYVAVSRLPLATAITLEFLGPLGVAITTAATWGQRGWAVPAAAGVVVPCQRWTCSMPSSTACQTSAGVNQATPRGTAPDPSRSASSRSTLPPPAQPWSTSTSSSWNSSKAVCSRS